VPDETFKALVVHETGDHRFLRQVGQRSLQELPPGEVLIRVCYSSLNYKDALSASGNKGVTRRYPHTPGIDAAGIVESSASPSVLPGEQVIVTGYDLGMNTPGGFGQFIRVPASWVVRLPRTLSLRESMIFGTAGFTAAMSVFRLQAGGLAPGSGDVLVTGATGGVGSLAVAILTRAGYRVVAGTGKPDQAGYLRGLGATQVIDRGELSDSSGRPLLQGRWAGVVDTVGGAVLATAIRSTQQRAVVTCCGNIAAAELQVSIYPFILRGVSLLGIDSANCPHPQRLHLWELLAGPWKIGGLEQLAREQTLETLDREIERMLAGQQVGRVLVNVAG